MSNLNGSITLWRALFCACLWFCLSAGHAAAGDLKFEAKLLWGTDEANPKDPDLKDVDPKIVEKLRSVFKWKSYFEIESKKDVVVPKGVQTKLKMSAKCQLEIRNLGEERVEVTLVGEGKRVVNRKQTVNPGELIVLGGEGQNATAWFVILIPAKSTP